MKKRVEATLAQVSVTSVHIDIDSEKILNRDITCEAYGKSQLGIPKDLEDQTILLSSQFKIYAKNREDAFCAQISADFYFKLDARVDDYDDIVREQCLPMIRKETTILTNKVLGTMGYGEFLSVD